MCMDEFVKRLYDFRGIYRIFWSQNSHYRYLPIFYRHLPIFYRHFFINSSTCGRKIKSRNFAEISGISDISPIFQRFFRFFSDFLANRLSVGNFVLRPADNRYVR